MVLTDYQQEALEKALERKRFGVFFQQRVGKTRVALAFIANLFQQEKARTALIVTTLTGREIWKQEIEKVWNELSSQKIRVLFPEELKMWKDLKNDLIVMIINYDKLFSLKEKLVRFNPSIVVSDECHLIKNRNSKRSKSLAKIGSIADYTLGLTGTPYSNKSLQDIFGIYRFIDPSLFGSKWGPFEAEYCIKGGYMGYQVVGYKNEDKLLSLVSESSIRVLRKDVMKEPQQESVIIPVSLSPSEKAKYALLKKHAILKLSSTAQVTADMVAVQRIRLQQFCGGFIMTDDQEVEEVSTAKMDKLKKLIDDLTEGGEQTVVSFKYLTEIAEAYRNFYPKCRMITGGVIESKRNEIIQDFREGKFPILLVQEQTVSMGVDLSHCKSMVFFSTGDDLITHNQIKDRLMGRFQKSEEVIYYYLLCEKTIDEKIYKALMNNISKAEQLANWKTWIEE